MTFDPDQPLTLGVEEELLLIDAETGELVPRARDVMKRVEGGPGRHTQNELNLCQIEIDTPVCTTLDQVHEALVALRGSLRVAARAVGCRVLPSGTHPFSTWTHQSVDREVARFDWMVDRYRLIASEQVICGAHVHVGLGGGDTDMRVMTRLQPWLPTLLALSANSPSWEGRDSGYASYRTEVWVRWPTAGFPPVMADRTTYEEVVDELVAAGVIPDSSFLYWYLRPSKQHGTLECRVFDTPLRVQDTVALAGLMRALSWRYAAEEVEGFAIDGAPALPGAGAPTSGDRRMPRRELLEAAMWQAARFGVEDVLLHPISRRPAPAAEVVQALLEEAHPGLVHHGDLERVTTAVHHILEEGNGASLQRRLAAQGADALEVIDRMMVAGGTKLAQ